VNLYLAGPMRGFAEFNHPAFRKATQLLRDAGHTVFSPAEHDQQAGLDTTGMRGDLTETEHVVPLRELLAADLAWICSHAEGIVVMPGWANSLGCRAEVAVAFTLGLPVWQLSELLLYGHQAHRVTTIPAVTVHPG
jgi:nucleoside 2-deoxyribosyltransferase